VAPETVFPEETHPYHRGIQMTKMIDYEDNVFYITERTKLLEKGLNLALDPALFSDRFLKDALFISESLERVRSQMDDSPHTLKRQENLRVLMLANQRFIRLLSAMTDQGYLDAQEGGTMSTLHENQVSELSGLLEDQGEGNADVEVISSQEFEFLLKEEEDPE
jgi:hypothetical protein